MTIQIGSVYLCIYRPTVTHATRLAFARVSAICEQYALVKWISPSAGSFSTSTRLVEIDTGPEEQIPFFSILREVAIHPGFHNNSATPLPARNSFIWLTCTL
ncbi:hypothetical protein Pelo_17963 [Pelomyxa schiedti]|nr:hypothetical protein Pelo_17963 [Pelomyxa schiedti]